ncbi:MAG: L-threonylcarbamoyladenylate synthase [Myxococcota bacterium]|nr:L-threonylcarbamoyladenylate synthase [Myxococcota bacterium]
MRECYARYSKQDLLQNLSAVEARFEQGQLCVFPTETFYGLAASIYHPEALIRLSALKNRGQHKPIALIAHSYEEVEKHFELAGELERLAKVSWPGPLTLVVKPKVDFPDALLGENGFVGVRVSPNTEATILAGAAGGLMTATSANFMGEPPVSHYDSIPDSLLDALDFGIDGGATMGGEPSTVLGWDGDLRVYREGAISKKEIKRLLSGLNDSK